MEAVELKLRTEQPADYRETENVTREAFWNLVAVGYLIGIPTSFQVPWMVYEVADVSVWRRKL